MTKERKEMGGGGKERKGGRGEGKRDGRKKPGIEKTSRVAEMKQGYLCKTVQSSWIEGPLQPPIYMSKS